ncbi:MAG: hypothetical protein K0S08_1578 [Gammaproteobacteria bacterium]|jgi:hypothetical protein|nr:hypothetical protein [Gammaproteobacteria bacterium]
MFFSQTSRLIDGSIFSFLPEYRKTQYAGLLESSKTLVWQRYQKRVVSESPHEEIADDLKVQVLSLAIDDELAECEKLRLKFCV